MKYTIAVIPGDGIGPEVINQAKRALDAVAELYDHIFLYKEAQMGAVQLMLLEFRYQKKQLPFVKMQMLFYLGLLEILNMIMILPQK